MNVHYSQSQNDCTDATNCRNNGTQCIGLTVLFKIVKCEWINEWMYKQVLPNDWLIEWYIQIDYEHWHLHHVPTIV